LLILFDIDATMVLTSRSGLWAMERAGRELFGSHFAIGDIEFAGRLDSLIIPELFERCGVAVTAANMAAYGDLYARLLDERLADPAVIKTVLPGVRELLDEIEKRAAAGVDVTLGLLTGNYERTGKAKLAACGIDPGRFAVGAFAEDASPPAGSRDDLPPVALSRYLARFGRAVAPERTVVIGDSPYDVRCAKVNGCRSLAVATGVHTVEQLRGCVPQGADLAVASLADTGRVAEWVFGNRG
jgi:phosphoglycolate phosphatase-like HAD superfamily hydrolase